MSNVLDTFLDKKKAESVYVSLEDGESVQVARLRDIKAFTKPGFSGELKECLRLIVDVDTVEGMKTKNFDNSTARFANELREKGVSIGSSFKITRQGVQTNTRYTISDVKSADGTPVASSAPAPATPTTPAAPEADHAAA